MPRIVSNIIVGGVDRTPPNAPQNLAVTGSTSTTITLDWDDNTETDLFSYNVYRRLGGSGDLLFLTNVTASTHTDTGLSPGLHEYEVTAVDESTNESLPSNIASTTIVASGTLSIALAGCSQTEYWVGDQTGIDGYRQLFPANANVFTSAVGMSGGTLKNWADSLSSEMDLFRAATTGNEDAILFQVCTQRFAPLATATDMTNAINNLTAEVPGVPIYLMPLDVAGPDDVPAGVCNQAAYDLSVTLIDGAIAASEALQGPEILPLYSAGETSDGCHPTEAGTARAAPIIDAWLQTVLDPYDMTPFSIPFAVNWPAPPITTQTTNVSTMAEWQAAVQVPQNRIIVAAGTYLGTLNITADDIDIVMDNGATLGSATPNAADLIIDNVSRLRWTGGTVWRGDSDTSGTISALRWDNVTDQLWDDVIFYGSLGYDISARIAWINCTIDHSATAEEFSFVCFDPVNATYSDFIFANVRAEADAPDSHSTFRLQGIQRCTIVDSAFNMGFGKDGFQGPDFKSTGLSMRSGCNDVFMENVSIGGTFFTNFVHAGLPVNYSINNLTANNIQRWFPQGSDPATERQGVIFDNAPATFDNTGHVSGVTSFVGDVFPDTHPSVGSPFNMGNSFTSDNVAVNAEWVSNDPAQLPDVSGIGAQRP